MTTRNSKTALVEEAAGALADAFEVRLVEPHGVELDENVRTKTQLTAEFLESIKALGVLQPVIAHVDALGQVIVTDGQRRVLAARQVGLASIPVLVGPAPGSAEGRVVEQLALNEARAALQTSELAAATQQLSLFGMEPETIARKIGRGPMEVRHLLRVAASKRAIEAAREVPELTIVQAARLAELADDPVVSPEQVAALEDAIVRDPDQADHVLSRAELDAREEAALRAVEAELDAQGVRHVRRDSEEWKKIWASGGAFSGLVDRKTGESLTDEEVRVHPGLVVGLRFEHGEVRRREYCEDPKKHGLCYSWEFRSSGGRVQVEKSEEERAAEAAERRRVVENNKRALAAAPVRHAFLVKMVQRGDTRRDFFKTFARVFFTFTHYGALQMERPENLLCEAMILPERVSVIGYAAVAKGNAKAVLLASMLATCEAHTDDKSFWRNTGYGQDAEGNPLVNRSCWYLRFLEGEGYALSDVEREFCEAAEKELAEVEKKRRSKKAAK